MLQGSVTGDPDGGVCHGAGGVGAGAVGIFLASSSHHITHLLLLWELHVMSALQQNTGAGGCATLLQVSVEVLLVY